MIAEERWRKLGWRHPMWDILRFYLSLRHKNEIASWLERLKEASTLSVDGKRAFQVDPADVQLFGEYITHRPKLFAEAFEHLRDEKEALDYCSKNSIPVLKNRTQNQGHHQSSKAMIATVTEISARVCEAMQVGLDPNPQRRCIWCTEAGLHVSARNLDGAIPSLGNPQIIWEIKEYWGKTSGGSKMSDAVYECQLVGRELREFEERSRINVTHVVFLDGKTQWTARQSDFRRFIDLLNQGLIDRLFVGREVETAWELELNRLLQANG